MMITSKVAAISAALIDNFADLTIQQKDELDSKKDMSLFVQYMKKGEMPLPEGELLDPYRHLVPFTKMQDEL